MISNCFIFKKCVIFDEFIVVYYARNVLLFTFFVGLLQIVYSTKKRNTKQFVTIWIQHLLNSQDINSITQAHTSYRFDIQIIYSNNNNEKKHTHTQMLHTISCLSFKCLDTNRHYFTTPHCRYCETYSLNGAFFFVLSCVRISLSRSFVRHKTSYHTKQTISLFLYICRYRLSSLFFNIFPTMYILFFIFLFLLFQFCDKNINY